MTWHHSILVLVRTSQRRWFTLPTTLTFAIRLRHLALNKSIELLWTVSLAVTLAGYFSCYFSWLSDVNSAKGLVLGLTLGQPLSCLLATSIYTEQLLLACFPTHLWWLILKHTKSADLFLLILYASWVLTPSYVLLHAYFVWRGNWLLPWLAIVYDWTLIDHIISSPPQLFHSLYLMQNHYTSHHGICHDVHGSGKCEAQTTAMVLNYFTIYIIEQSIPNTLEIRSEQTTPTIQGFLTKF